MNSEANGRTHKFSPVFTVNTRKHTKAIVYIYILAKIVRDTYSKAACVFSAKRLDKATYYSFKVLRLTCTLVLLEAFFNIGGPAPQTPLPRRHWLTNTEKNNNIFTAILQQLLCIETLATADCLVDQIAPHLTSVAAVSADREASSASHRAFGPYTDDTGQRAHLASSPRSS